MEVEELAFASPEPAHAEDIPAFLIEDDVNVVDGADIVAVGADDDRVWDDEVHQLHVQLAEAEDTIVRLEADRSLARMRIEELEAAEEWAQVVITQQRRRLLVLERQVEDIRPPLEPDVSLPPSGRASWLDRLLGGVSTPESVDA